AKQALQAKRLMHSGEGDADWLQGRLDLYEVYAANVLGHCSSRLAAVGQGADVLHRLSADVLSA
ncbi:MAG: acyl-CoA dehydrogenase, partial [Brevundimonas sp.]